MASPFHRFSSILRTEKDTGTVAVAPNQELLYPEETGSQPSHGLLWLMMYDLTNVTGPSEVYGVWNSQDSCGVRFAIRLGQKGISPEGHPDR